MNANQMFACSTRCTQIRVYRPCILNTTACSSNKNKHLIDKYTTGWCHLWLYKCHISTHTKFSKWPLLLERYTQKCSVSTQQILSPDARYTKLPYKSS